MDRTQASRQHTLFSPACHGRVEQEEVDVGVGVPMVGPYYCPDCEWVEGKVAESKLPTMETRDGTFAQICGETEGRHVG